MWTPTTRRQHSRDGLRYETDLTDAEWAVIEPLLPPPSRRGRPPKWTKRQLLDAIFYVLRGGIAWSLMPKDLPPKSTVFDWFCALRDGCVFEKLNFALVAIDRERAGREASPSAAILDSQSVKTTESGGPRGYDAGKKINGRKRHALTDTDGRALLLEPHSAGIQSLPSGLTRGTATPPAPCCGPRVRSTRSSSTCLPTAPMRANLSPRHRGRDRPQARRPGRLRAAAATLGGRALLRLDQPQPSPRQGCRGDDRLSPRLPLRRRRHAARPPHRKGSMTFPDGLLGSHLVHYERPIESSPCNHNSLALPSRLRESGVSSCKWVTIGMANQEKVFARDLLVATAPDEAEFFEEYCRGFNQKPPSGRLGPDFGIHELTSLGPTAVGVGLFLFEVLRSWLADVPKKIVQGLIVDRAKDQLKDWLASPQKAGLSEALSAEGKAEILSIVGGLIVQAKLPSEEAEVLTKRVAAQLFGSNNAAKK